MGEWLTRRILRSFSDMGEEAPAMPYDRSYERAPMSSAGLDPWGLPPTSASRRDSEDMLSRVSRSEAESSEAYRRIEEHLRTVQRRLDSAERSQSENNRAMNKTATEINIATREQAQAFDQMGGHVMGIGDRLERLERGAQQDGLKDAVKALHQGLSRLADQISSTATQSAQQAAIVAGNLDQMAGRLDQVRSDVEARARRLEARVAAVEEDARNRFASFEAETARALDQRLAAVEKASHFNTNALDHALERLEAQAGVRAGDQAELQKRHAETDGAISRLEESMERLEAANADPGLERRLDSIERALGSLVSRLETYDPAAPLEDTLRDMTRRMDTVEKNHTDLMHELRANLAGGGKPYCPRRWRGRAELRPGDLRPEKFRRPDNRISRQFRSAAFRRSAAGFRRRQFRSRHRVRQRTAAAARSGPLCRRRLRHRRFRAADAKAQEVCRGGRQFPGRRAPFRPRRRRSRHRPWRQIGFCLGFRCHRRRAGKKAPGRVIWCPRSSPASSFWRWLAASC